MTDSAAPAQPAPDPTAAAPDPTAIIRSRSYVVLLLVGAIIGVPVAAVAYFFLDAVAKLQHEIFVALPTSAGFHGEPLWWPLPWLTLSGLLVALAIRYLPGTGGHEPSEGFKAGGPVQPVEFFGIVAAAFATLSLGVVLGPEAPLIAIGSGLGVLAVHLFKRDAPPMAVVVIGVAGSFAAIATLLGSPIVGAFLLMEMAGLGGPMMELVLVPGLLSAGVGALIFVGLDNLTGFGTFSLNVGPLPHVGSPTGSEFLWAIVIGLGSAVAATAIFRLAGLLRPLVERNRLVLTPMAGLAVVGLAVAFAAGTTHGSSVVLFSGQTALPDLVQQAAGWTVGALVLLIVCKGLAYAISLSGFRGGPIFPSMFIGAAGGIALSHVGGLPVVAGAAMGVGAMVAGALKMPMTAVLLPSLLFLSDAVALMPVVIVAVVVSYVVAIWITPAQKTAAAAAVPAAPAAPAARRTGRSWTLPGGERQGGGEGRIILPVPYRHGRLDPTRRHRPAVHAAVRRCRRMGEFRSAIAMSMADSPIPTPASPYTSLPPNGSGSVLPAHHAGARQREPRARGDRRAGQDRVLVSSGGYSSRRTVAGLRAAWVGGRPHHCGPCQRRICSAGAVVAALMYGDHSRGYAYGGSGGGYRTIGSAENTSGVWDGFVPTSSGPDGDPEHVHGPHARAADSAHRFDQIVDAVDPAEAATCSRTSTPRSGRPH